MNQPHIPLSQDAALVVALAGTAMPFAHSAEDEAERWLRALRLHGEVGTALQGLGVGEAPLMTGSEAEEGGPGTPPMGADVLNEVTRRPAVRRLRRLRRSVRASAVQARHERRGAA